ncbi:MAG: zinc-ribbon domain-containing protein [Candidatus Nanoarchaeia archaeon]
MNLHNAVSYSCPKCNMRLNSNDNFCSYCGYNLKAKKKGIKNPVYLAQYN